MTEHVAVVGAGIVGMCTALALTRSELNGRFRVTLLERDIPPPVGDADQAFFEWQRRGAAQFKHPHAFLGLMCSLLEQRYPELLEGFFAAGARRVDFADMVPPRLLSKYVPQAGDEQMWVLMCRRATMETVLRHYVEAQGAIQILNKTYVTGIVTERQNDSLVLTGLETTDRANDNFKSVFEADVFVDAAGRSSKFPTWLRKHGARIDESVDDAEIVYYTRHYKLLPGVDEPSRHREDPSAGDLGYMKYGVFPGDGGHFALIICVPNDESELREAVKDGTQFDQICRTIPGLVPWIAEDKATPTTPSFGIGDIKAVWRDYIHDGQAQAHNYFAVGDAAVRTNPLYGRGCSVGSLHAHLLAEVLATHGDPETRALQFAAVTTERLRPIYDASLREDKNGIKRADAVRQGLDRDKADSLKKWFGLAFGDALAAAVREELHVFRGMMRTVNLVEKPGDFLKDPKIKRTIFRYMLNGRKRNARARVQRGLSRAKMLAHLQTLESNGHTL